MEEILKIINAEMQALGIDYYYLTNNASQVTYPYVTGEYTENGYSYEINATTGDMLLEAWNRSGKLELIKVNDKIKDHFRDLTISKDDITAHISYAGCFPVRTNDATLDKLEIHLDISYWKGV